jgi:hypothetical protein
MPLHGESRKRLVATSYEITQLSEKLLNVAWFPQD